MSDNKVWRCPQCETINHTNFCVVCGKKRPVETDNNKGTAEYIQKNKELNSSMDKLRSALDDQQEKKKKYGTVKKKRLLIIVIVLMCAIAALAYMYFGGVIGNINSPNKNYQSLIDAYIDALSSGDAEKYVSLFPEEYVNAAKSKDEFYSRVSAYKEGYLARGNYSSGDVAYGSQYPSFTDVTGIEPAEVNDRTDEYNYISYSYNADRDDLTKYINRLTEEYDFLWDGTSEWNLNGTGEWNYTECMLVDNICGIDENLIIFPDNSDDGLIEIRAIRSISSYIERSDFRESAKTKFGQNLKSCEITDINDEENAELLRTVQDRSGQYGFEVSDAREFNIKEEYSDYTANATYWAVEVDNSWYIFDTYWFAAFVY